MLVYASAENLTYVYDDVSKIGLNEILRFWYRRDHLKKEKLQHMNQTYISLDPVPVTLGETPQSSRNPFITLRRERFAPPLNSAE